MDKIFKKIYEDDVTSVISYEQFLKLSVEYETKQEDLPKQVAEFQKETVHFDRRQTEFKRFREIIRKYLSITELTPTIVNEFIKKILSMPRINQANAGDKRYGFCLTLLANYRLKMSLFMIKRKFRRIISNSAEYTFLLTSAFLRQFFISETASFIFSKVSSLIICSIRQASFSATWGETPKTSIR